MPLPYVQVDELVLGDRDGPAVGLRAERDIALVLAQDALDVQVARREGPFGWRRLGEPCAAVLAGQDRRLVAHGMPRATRERHTSKVNRDLRGLAAPGRSIIRQQDRAVIASDHA